MIDYFYSFECCARRASEHFTHGYSAIVAALAELLADEENQ